MKPDEYVEAISNARESELTYFIDPDYYSLQLINDYLSGNTSFDTDFFRTLAEFIKTRVLKNGAFDTSKGGGEAAFKRIREAWANGKPEDIDFEIICYQSDFSRFSKLPSKKSRPFPDFSPIITRSAHLSASIRIRN